MTEVAPEIGQPEPVRPGPDRDDKAEDEFGVSPELVLAVRDCLREGRLEEAATWSSAFTPPIWLT